MVHFRGVTAVWPCFVGNEGWFHRGRVLLLGPDKMDLSSAVRKIIAEVEDLSGMPVNVQADPSLKTLAKITPARGQVSFHSLSYRPNAVGLDYVIAFQLGFLLRNFRCLEEKRYEVVSDQSHFEKAVEDFDLGRFPQNIAKQLFDSLIIQLRSMSIGERVDQWILAEYPEFGDQQGASVRAQLKENQKALSPEIRKMFPGKVLQANLAMSAAHARIWSKRLNDARYSLAYKAAGYEEVAGNLVACWNEISTSSDSDKELIGSWARVLGLDPYFDFKKQSSFR